MKLMKKGNSLDGIFGKKSSNQNPLAIVAVVAVLVVALFFIARNFIGGGPGDYAPQSAAPSASAAVNPPASAPAAPAGKPAPAFPHPHARPNAPAGKPAPGALARIRKAKAANVRPVKPVKMESVTVFGSVVVSYPAGWGLKVGAAEDVAVFTNGKAYFEVHAPNPTATTAEAIASLAMKTLGKGDTVLDEGPDKIGANKAYVYDVKSGGQQMRIIGLDAPTRIVVREYVKGAPVSSCESDFQLIQSKLAFN